MNTASMIALVLMVLVIYFSPTIIGANKANKAAIFTLNLFLGWTFIGWVVALVWALMKDNPPIVKSIREVDHIIPGAIYHLMPGEMIKEKDSNEKAPCPCGCGEGI